jgi:tetratricopeptide (TPR) repeat protein
VYSIYDKISKREVLYTDHVIKYGLVGPRGAWVSGGMEFSFPYAHTTDTVSPVESRLVHNPDGSATAYVGALDWVSNMDWQIGITLRPNTARLEEDVTLFNSTPANHLYLFWTNTAVHATQDAQYIYPMREAIFDDPFAVVQSWPEWKGVDRSWYKNNPGALAIFARNVHRNFFGVYYHKSNYGVVHVANFRQDPGKKFWTWGTAPSGTIWDHILSDNDGPYNEIQSGRFYTQGSREFMNPRRIEKWTEYWYPVRGLDGGYVEATPQMAINAVYPEGNASEVKLAISPVADVSNATIVVKNGSASDARVLKRISNVNLTPLDTATYTIPVSNVENAKKNLLVEIQNSDGKTILHWNAAEPVDGNLDLVPEVGKTIKKRIAVTPKTQIQQLYLHGVFLQKTGDWRGSTKIYEQVLQRDPGYVPALLKEAWRNYHAADFTKAESLLERAIDRDNDVNSDPAIPYALGVVERADGKLSRAKDAFWTAIHYGSSLPPGPSLAPPFVELGEIAIQQKDYSQAAELLRQAVAYNPNDGFALADLAVAERLGGEPRQAAKDAAEAVEKMPLLPYALAEQWQNNGTPAGSESWTKIIDSDPENYLAVAAWYHSLGAWKSSDEVLQVAIKNLPADQISPMIYGYLASNAGAEGNSQKAAEYGKKAASLPAQGVFPNRLSDIAILREALKHSPSDTHAKYALGNFLFAHARYDDAAKLWQQALAGGFNNAVLLRNLAVYEQQVKGDPGKAADYYKRAIKLTPNDYRLYTSLDEVYGLQGNVAAREALFRNAPASVLTQDTVRGRRAVLALEQSKPDAALALLKNHTFKPWEGGRAIHQMYVQANMEKGKAALKSGQAAKAAEDFKQAMLYPESLGTGRPPSPDLSQQQYWLGSALKAQGKAAEAQSMWKKAAAHESVFSALAYRKLGQNDKAQQILQRKIHAANQQGATAIEYLEAARAEEFSGNTDAARKYFKKALEMNPVMWEASIEMKQLGQKGGSGA